MNIGHLTDQHLDAIAEKHSAAWADAYRRAHNPKGLDHVRNAVENARDFARACFGRRWWKIWLMAALLLASVGGCMRLAQGVEVPDRIVAAVAMIESGATWNNTGDIHGTWTTGAAGEISHWQLTDAVLSDLGLVGKRRQIARSPVYAESVFRLWYSHLLDRTGSHASAIAAYHRGLGGRNRLDARAYAERVLNIAASIN